MKGIESKKVLDEEIQKVMADDTGLHVVNNDVLGTAPNVPPVEITITIKQQDIGNTTSIFLKPNAFGSTSDKWIANEITRVVEKVSEQFREEYFFNIEEKTSDKTPNKPTLPKT